MDAIGKINFKIMIEEKDILFVTTTLYTKWLNKQQSLINKYFPGSTSIVIPGTSNWPRVWFDWIKELKNHTDKKYAIHIDEDCFIQNREEILKLIQNMEESNIDICGVPDGYHHYRGANSMAINTFFMVVSISKVLEVEPLLNLDQLQFVYDHNNGWMNNFGVIFDKSHLDGYHYKFPTQENGSNYYFEQEPYYYFLWMMMNNGAKFDYLYPHFDDTYKSTNPRIDENSPDIAIHLWYTRQWNTTMDVWGLPNIERYNRLETNLNI